MQDTAHLGHAQKYVVIIYCVILYEQFVQKQKKTCNFTQTKLKGQIFQYATCETNHHMGRVWMIQEVSAKCR